MKTDAFYIKHILEQTEYLLGVSEGLTKEAFLKDKTLILAVERSLEIIGGAVVRLGDDFKAQHAGVEWQRIRGLRNIVAHVYWAIDYDVIWQVLTEEIEPLDTALRLILESP